MNRKTLYYVRADSEVLDLSTSQYRKAYEIMEIEKESYDRDPLLVMIESFMIEDPDGHLSVVKEPGNYKIIECYWTGMDGIPYGVGPEALTVECEV